MDISCTCHLFAEHLSITQTNEEINENADGYTNVSDL